MIFGRHGNLIRWTATAALLTVCGCSASNWPLDEYEQLEPATMMEAPQAHPDLAKQYPEAVVTHGRYLLELLGCASCHTDGALIGEPRDDRQLGGSHVGIAYSNPLKDRDPGVVFPSNITPDTATGIGSWSDEQIAGLIRTGADRRGRQHLAVMPWPAYARISEEDVNAIVAYLRSIPPVRFAVPENVPNGQPTEQPYVHFGVYRRRD